MAAVVFIGDEISAAGWQLAGAQILAPDAGSETAALARACASVDLVLVSAATAVHIDVQALRRATAALAPLVLVVPDAQGQAALPDLAARLRAQLGLEA